MLFRSFIGSCTNGRMEDMRKAALLLKGRKVAPGVILKIVPATDAIWKACLDEGIISIFKDAGALVSNAGCAGCAAGQVGQNGQGEITVSTGNRNFPGKQGKGMVFLASPEIAAASAIAGYITTPGKIPDEPALFTTASASTATDQNNITDGKEEVVRQTVIEGRTWIIKRDNIDTDMIFHNRYLAVTDINEMGRYTFDNLKGYEDFAAKAAPGDIVLTGQNFGSGSSRQQAVDCFKSLGIQAVVAASFGAIYERNAINAAFPVVTCRNIDELDPADGDPLRIDFISGKIVNLRNNRTTDSEAFSEVQLEIFRKGGLLSGF